VLQRGGPRVVLSGTGLLAERGDTLGILHADGRFLDLNEAVRVVMEPDGSVALNGGVLTIAEDGTASMQMRGVAQPSLHFDEAGRVVGAREETRVEGLTPALRRTAMFALLLPDILRIQRSPSVE
jgi:hypothetical protein